MSEEAKHQGTATGSAEEASALMRELGITPMQGCVAVGQRQWIVMTWEWRKLPRITRWLGWPVRYRMGGGPPQAFRAWGEATR